MVKLIFNGVVDMTSKIHVAIPNNTQMLIDLGAGDLHVGFIVGSYSRNIDYEKTKTEFGDHYLETSEGKRIRWGAPCSSIFGKRKREGVPFLKTKTLQEIYDEENEFTITSMEIQAPYERKIDGKYIQSIALFPFRSWSFKPKMIRKIFNRMPSQALYDKIKTMRKKWELDKETLKRQRDTWLINRMMDNIPPYAYKLWLNSSFAMILPETSSSFLGKELGTDYKEVF